MYIDTQFQKLYSKAIHEATTKLYISSQSCFPLSSIKVSPALLSNLQDHVRTRMASSSAALFFVLSLISASALTVSALDRDFSIVGYSPEDLKSIGGLIELFESWMAKHGKRYESLEEKLHRFEVFKENLMHIDETNKKISSYWLGLNQFADLTHEEFKKRYLGLRKVDLSERRQSSEEEFTYRGVVDLPKSVDWRKKAAVTPVKNQGSCGRFLWS